MRHEILEYQRNELALTLAVESSPNGILMHNAAGVIQFANRAIESLFGYHRSELIGSTMEMLLPTRFRVRHQKDRDTFSHSESSKVMAGRDLWGLPKDGVEIPLQVYVNRIESDIGDLILCTVIDIAERVKYQKLLDSPSNPPRLQIAPRATFWRA